MQCGLIYGFLKCALPEDTIDLDLKVCNLKGHSYIQKRLQITND